MNYRIRSFKETDLNEIQSWDKSIPIPKGMLVENGTFILELNNIPALCLTVILTQTKEMSYLFGFIKNPIFKISLEPYGKLLWDHCTGFAKEKGYKRILCFANVEKLKQKYERFGMTKTMDGLSSFMKEL